jgi:hypothetical protein
MNLSQFSDWLGNRLVYQMEGMGIPTLAQAAARIKAMEEGNPTSQRDGFRGYTISPEEFMTESMPGGGIALRVAGKPTVRHPKRRAFPKIYRDEKEIVDESAAKVVPEDPLLEEYFGVSRRDLDDRTRALEQIDNIDIPVQAQKAAPQRVLDLMLPGNERRLRSIMEYARERPEFTGSYGWYELSPLLEKYIKEWGPEKGRQLFSEFNQYGAAFSPQNDVLTETMMASLAQYAKHLKDPGLYKRSAELGLHGDYRKFTEGTHARAVDRVMRGEFFANPDLSAAHKTKNYYHSRMGDQFQYPTQDAHFARVIGLPDTREVTALIQSRGPKAVRDKVKANPSKAEPPGIRTWFRDRIAVPIGMTGSPAQALLWNAAGTSTKVKTDLCAPFLELMLQAARRRAAVTGESPQTVMDRFIAGQGHL